MSTPTAPVVKTVRPYTCYNLFFQLEREYILQITHGHQPTTNKSSSDNELFDPLDRSNYQGPPLPSRYANLILPYDWHIPGKTQRRKRSHRKSHGKIGFRELNEQISKAWSFVDEETRRFCTCLSELEGRKYKNIRKKNKKAKKDKKKKHSIKIKKVPKKKEDDDCKNDMFVSSFDWAPADDLDPQEDFTDAAPKIIARIISRESFSQDSHHRQREQLSRQDSITLSEVDMHDDEIMDLWDSTPIEDEATTTTCQMCVEISSSSSGHDSRQLSMLPRLQEKETQEVVGDDARMSFIDEEYERFKELGEQFKTNKRSSSVNIGVGIPGTLKRKAFMARGA